MTFFILVSVPFWCWERAFATSAKTRRGAMARRPPTKNWPKSPMPVAFGKISARITPSTIPIAILFIRLVLFQVVISR